MKVFQAALDAMQAGLPTAMVTVTGIDGSAPRQSGARMLVHADGSIVGTVGGGTFEHRCIMEALAVIESGQTRIYSVHLTQDLGMCCGGKMDALIEPLEPQATLVIHGAGHVATAVASLARTLAFRVIVLDERDDWADPARFPADVDVRCQPHLRSLDALPRGPLAHHMVVTHSHQLDQDLIEQLLEWDLAWLGLIGSRTKLTRFCIRLRAAGVSEEKLARISGPVGLDIGAETPEEIAVSVAGELIHLRRGGTGSCTPLSADPIPARGGDGKAHPGR